MRMPLHDQPAASCRPICTPLWAGGGKRQAANGGYGRVVWRSEGTCGDVWWRHVWDPVATGAVDDGQQLASGSSKRMSEPRGAVANPHARVPGLLMKPASRQGRRATAYGVRAITPATRTVTLL